MFNFSFIYKLATVWHTARYVSYSNLMHMYSTPLRIAFHCRRYSHQFTPCGIISFGYMGLFWLGRMLCIYRAVRWFWCYTRWHQCMIKETVINDNSCCCCWWWRIVIMRNSVTDLMTLTSQTRSYQQICLLQYIGCTLWSLIGGNDD